MANKAHTPHYKTVGYAYEQAEELGFDWRFPCNPDLEDLCDRGEYAGVVPVVVFLPSEQAQAVFDGKASLKYSNDDQAQEE